MAATRRKTYVQCDRHRRRTHPGETLREEFMVPLAHRAYALARYFGTTAQFCLNLQRAHDLSMAEIDVAAELAIITPRQLNATVIG